MELEDQKMWQKKLDHNYYDAWTALLLAVTTNIDTLDLGLPLLHCSTLLPEVLGLLIRRRSPTRHFTRLKSVILGENERRGRTLDSGSDGDSSYRFCTCQHWKSSISP
ncbi:hypothetical protein BJY04DRAFT_172399 [Aspergillus karnatakaensis]|uniref:uncharacterized protein n=1 Tax=Aspergillus karnatakaensis TaxID=1810916 RepID=UPI003CCCE07A